MLLALTFACTGTDADSAAATETGDTGVADSGDTNDTDTNDTDTNDTGTNDTDTGSDPEPVYGYAAGPTGILFEMNYAGVPAAEDVIRYGLWTNGDRLTPPEVMGVAEATFPSSVTIEVAAGTWYGGAFLDVGGDNGDLPDESEDFVSNWDDSLDRLWPIPVQEGSTTTGITLTFGE